MCCGGAPGSIYGLGFLGALVYFLQHATTAQAMIVGVVQAIFWPAVLIYKILGLLGI